MTREIKRRLEDLEGPDPADLPTAGLCSGFAALDEESDVTAEWVDVDRQIIYVHGEPHYVPDVLLGLYMEATE
jgi:hypothetical protein